MVSCGQLILVILNIIPGCYKKNFVSKAVVSNGHSQERKITQFILTLRLRQLNEINHAFIKI